MYRFSNSVNNLRYVPLFCADRSLSSMKGFSVSTTNVFIKSHKQSATGFHTSNATRFESFRKYSYGNFSLPAIVPYSNYCHRNVHFPKFFTPLPRNLLLSRHSSSNQKENVKDFNASDHSHLNSVKQSDVKLSQKDKLKRAVRDYGATVVVFHVSISLASLGICYFLISNGIDATFVLKAVGFSECAISSKVAVGGGTFVIAYAVHKMFAPVRIAVTLSATPFIVRYLRKIGFLRPPKSLKPPK